MEKKPNQIDLMQNQRNPFKPNHKSKSLTTVRQLVDELQSSNKPRQFSQRKKQVIIDRQQLRKNLKQKWRDPGYVNIEFSNYKALKGKFLSEWELERIYLATRSYQAPKSTFFFYVKDFKGLKQCIQSQEFPSIPKNMYSEKFQRYIAKVEEKNENELFNTKKSYTEASTTSYRTQMSTQKRKFNPNGTQSKAFGMGTVLWKTGQRSKIKTIEDY